MDPNLSVQCINSLKSSTHGRRLYFQVSMPFIYAINLLANIQKIGS